MRRLRLLLLFLLRVGGGVRVGPLHDVSCKGGFLVEVDARSRSPRRHRIRNLLRTGWSSARSSEAAVLRHLSPIGETWQRTVTGGVDPASSCEGAFCCCFRLLAAAVRRNYTDSCRTRNECTMLQPGSGCVSVSSTPGQTESTLYKSGTEETLLSSASFSPGSTVGSSPVRDFFWEQQDQDLLSWASGILRRDLVCALEAELSSPQNEAQQLQMQEQAPAAAGTAKYRALVTTSVCETLRHTLSERRHPRSGAALHEILAEQFILASDSSVGSTSDAEQSTPAVDPPGLDATRFSRLLPSNVLPGMPFCAHVWFAVLFSGNRKSDEARWVDWSGDPGGALFLLHLVEEMAEEKRHLKKLRQQLQEEMMKHGSSPPARRTSAFGRSPSPHTRFCPSRSSTVVLSLLRNGARRKSVEQTEPDAKSALLDAVPTPTFGSGCSTALATPMPGGATASHITNPQNTPFQRPQNTPPPGVEDPQQLRQRTPRQGVSMAPCSSPRTSFFPSSSSGGSSQHWSFSALPLQLQLPGVGVRPQQRVPPIIDREQQEREQQLQREQLQREQQLVSWIRKADQIVEELSLQQSLIEGWVQANLQTLLRPLRPLASYRSVAAVYRHAADRTKLFLVQTERKLLASAGARDADHVHPGRAAAAESVARSGDSCVETEVQAKHRREQGRGRSDSAGADILESCVRKLGRPRTELMVGASVGIDPLAVAPYCREGVAEAVADFLEAVAQRVENLQREAVVSTVSPPSTSSAWSALEPCAEQPKGVAQLNSENVDHPTESLPKPTEPKRPSVSTCGRPSSLLDLFFPEAPAAERNSAIEAAARAVDLYSARKNGTSGVGPSDSKYPSAVLTESCAAKLISPFLIVADESQWPAAVRTFRRFLARLRFGRTTEGKLEFRSKRECMGCSDECYLLAVIYLDRVARKNEGLLLHMRKNTLHFLLLTALVVAAKFWDDDYLSMAQYARAGCTTKEQLADMERLFLKLLGYELDVAPQEFMRYAEQLSAIASAEKARKIAVQQEVALSSRGGADGVVLDGGGAGAVTPAPGPCADKKDGQEPPGRDEFNYLLRKTQLEGEGKKKNASPDVEASEREPAPGTQAQQRPDESAKGPYLLRELKSSAVPLSWSSITTELEKEATTRSHSKASVHTAPEPRKVDKQAALPRTMTTTRNENRKWMPVLTTRACAGSIATGSSESTSSSPGLRPRALFLGAEDTTNEGSRGSTTTSHDECREAASTTVEGEGVPVQVGGACGYWPCFAGNQGSDLLLP